VHITYTVTKDIQSRTES